MLDNIPLLALFIAVVSVAFAGLSFGLSMRKSKMEKLTHESQFVITIHRELTKIEENFNKLQNPNECLDYAVDYLNTLETLCFFNGRRYLEKDIIDFFKNYLKWGLGYYQWLIDIDALKEETLKDHYANVVKTCDEHGIKPTSTLQPLFENHRRKIRQKKKQ